MKPVPIPAFVFWLLSAVSPAGEPDAVTREEVAAALGKLDTAEQAALTENPALRREVGQLMLTQRLILREARRQQWEQRPEVQAKIERARERVIAESWIQAVAGPAPDYPSEAEIAAAYEARKEALRHPRQFHLAQIFIACPKSAGKADAERATAKLKRVQQQLAAYMQDFSAIARAESDDPVSAGAGGTIGWLGESRIQPELRPLVMKLLKHEVSAPVRLEDGWHILKCLDKREAGLMPLESVRAALITQLRAAKLQSGTEAIVARLLKENSVTLNDETPAGALSRQSK